MLVAATLMAVAIAGLMTGLSGATRNAARLRDYDRIVQLARLRMNDILADQRAPLNSQFGGQFPPELVGNLNAGWRALVTKSEQSPAPFFGDFVIDRVQLELWWMAGEQRRAFSLEGYRSRPFRADEAAPPGNP
jgi:hypothetical protein